MKQYAIKALTHYGKVIYSSPYNNRADAENKAEYYKERGIFAMIKIVEREVTHWKEVKK